MPRELITVKVLSKSVAACDIFKYELVSASDVPLPAFSAGAHIDVCLPNGLVRQYSLCNPPGDRSRYEIAVLRVQNSRGGSIGMHELVHQGDTLTIGVPQNHFPLSEGARSSLLIAGGIGVTPLLSMAEQLSVTGSNFQMHYFSRSKNRTAFFDRIHNSDFAGRVSFHFDDENPSACVTPQAVLASASPDAHVYVCGPKGFMDAVLSYARAQSFSEKQLHYEFFSGASASENSGSSFTVVLARSGRSVDVPGDKSVVHALADVGVEIETSCEQGVCGTCLTSIIDGVPDHRDLYLTAEEKAANDRFLPCCSRAKTARLVLDI